MRIRIIKPGILSTIQDLGRPLYHHEAIPNSGAMDSISARLANIALGNKDDDAVIELTYSGAVFFCESDVLIAYAGEGSSLMVNNNALPKSKPVYIPAGNYIEAKKTGNGCRMYVAIAGGWDVPKVLGSRSTYLLAGFGGLQGRALEAGDILSGRDYQEVTAKIINELQGEKVTYPRWQIAPAYFHQPGIKEIQVIAGQECNRFNGASITTFFSEPFAVLANSNRMGINLNGPILTRLSAVEMLSAAVTPGTIQVTNSGNPVILAADCQTTGGYPRIAQVVAACMPICGQLMPGDKVLFKPVTWHEAEEMFFLFEDHLHTARAAISSKYL